MFKPQFRLTNKILKNLTEIAEARVTIQRARLLPQNEIKLRRQAFIRMSQSSTAIEGNQLNVAEVAAVYANKHVDAPKRDVYEVRNYQSALKYVQKLIHDKRPLTERVLLHMHKLATEDTLSPERSGHYRKVLAYVVRRRLGHPVEVVYTGPAADKTKKLVKELLQWVNVASRKDNTHPIIVAGIMHHEIAAIHPFSDGNGRTARALATLILWQRGYDFRQLFALEEYYNQERRRYYQAINIGPSYAKRSWDSTKWLEYFVQGFGEEIKNVLRQVKALSGKKVGNHVAAQVILQPNQLKVLEFIDQVGRATAKDVIDILSVPKRTAQYELGRLKALKMVKAVGKGRATYYVLEK